MKISLTIIRWIVGLLFIVSGLVKANDPLGLSYKMQEFFEVWGIHSLNDLTLPLAIIMNVFEIVAGVAVLIGWQMRIFSWLLLLLIVFFTFLTAYALFSGKIKTCGCFGDCIPITPMQSFLKDLFLLLLIAILCFNARKIPSGLSSTAAVAGLLLCTLAVVALQFFVLRYLPLIDCLPYKKGNDLLNEMKTPPGAVADSFSINFRYKKNGKVVEFDQDHFPADFDSSFEYVDRYDKLIRQGNATPAITDLSFKTLSGTDTTTALLNTPDYVLVFVKTMEEYADWKEDYDEVAAAAKQKNIPVFIVSGEPDKAAAVFGANNVVTGDAVVMKTAARVDPTFFLMKKAVVIEKRSYANVDPLVEKIK
jgi:uncharacterized membrane protein YphA (DoxX/SURF4 family)